MEGSREGTTIEASEQRIDELSRELDVLRAERDKLNEEALKWAEKRDRLHKEIKKTRLEADRLKERRDELNFEVQCLKTLREDGRKSRREKIDQIKKKRQKVREAAADMPRRSSRSLENEIAAIEWKIQTNSLSLDEERTLVERVKALENEMEVYREIGSINVEIANLENGVKALKAELLRHRERILEIAKQSQGFHEKMIRKVNKIKELKTEADEMHAKYIELKEKAKVFHERSKEFSGQIKAIRNVVHQKEGEERARQQADLRQKLEEGALDKLKRGEKLTFDEFKLLAEQGKI
ncbi:MAG: hypothetical protein NWF14_03780 [Candidatus Bathyarchaeota archaeon]|nr:hypothetical protein [Candidatus Bathyarchaeota archaeon]